MHSFLINIHSPSDNLVTFGGKRNREGPSANVEITSLGPNNRFNCTIPDLPNEVREHSTIKTKIGVITCGGSNYITYENRCYRLAFDNSWVQFPMMNEKRADFAMEEGNGKLFSVGGLLGKPWKLVGNSMEWIDLTNGLRWTQQDLPFTIYDHCMTKFNKTHLIVTGGYLNSTVCKMSLKQNSDNNSLLKFRH